MHRGHGLQLGPSFHCSILVAIVERCPANTLYSLHLQMITMITKKSLEPGKQHLEKQCAQLFGELHQVSTMTYSTQLLECPDWTISDGHEYPDYK